MSICWFHKFTKWSNPLPGQVRWFDKPWTLLDVQERTCVKCNKRELRVAA